MFSKASLHCLEDEDQTIDAMPISAILALAGDSHQKMHPRGLLFSKHELQNKYSMLF